MRLLASLCAVNNRLNACRASPNAGPIKGREVPSGYLSFVRFEDTPLSLAPLINELRGDRSIIPKRCSRDGSARRGILRDMGRKPSAAHTISGLSDVFTDSCIMCIPTHRRAPHTRPRTCPRIVSEARSLSVRLS